MKIVKTLPKKYQKYHQRATANGLSGQTYLLGSKFVLKLYSNKSRLKEELSIYKALQKANLKVPRVVEVVDGGVIFKQIGGFSPKKPTKYQLKEICLFAKKIHQVSPKTKNSPFGRDSLQELINRYSLSQIDKLLKEISISPKSDTFIHGDLFLDNSKFIGSRLKGVFDFSDSGWGDERFEFAVIAISWCRDRDFLLSIDCIETIFEWVEGDFLEFLDYIGYALLFFATKRFTLRANYQELIKIYKNLRKQKW